MTVGVIANLIATLIGVLVGLDGRAGSFELPIPVENILTRR